MSQAIGADTTSSFCASCGIAEIDYVKLTDCDGCDLVRYCSDACQREHTSEHVEDCKKRATELRDELLFKQPEGTHLGDCPICCLPMPLDITKSSIASCCSKMICDGCVYADLLRRIEGRLKDKCAFCREPTPETKEESDKQRMKRLEANDPVALRREGFEHYNKGDHSGAFEYCTRAAQLGDVEAHYRLAILYLEGNGVEKDEEKAIHHLEEAAIGGHPKARCFLGGYEYENGNTERAVKHWIIAATQGDDDSIKTLMNLFKRGDISKEDLVTTLRAHQAAVDATKSPQREVA